MLDIRSILKDKGITQTEFAREINVEKSTLSNYINGRREPELKILCRMADVLGVSCDYLLGRPSFQTFALTEEEKCIVVAFRAADEDTKELVSLALKRWSNAGKMQDAAVS